MGKGRLLLRNFFNLVLCKLGCHWWWWLGPQEKVCKVCDQKVRLVFYSNRTQEWIQE
jgi:hypothetical protein